MDRVVRLHCIVVPFVLAATLSAPAAGDTQIGIHIGIPAPPPVIVSPPPFVIVPTTPAVRYAPDFALNVFLYAGRYYAWSDGSWFVSLSLGAPWAFIEPARVPHPVLVVPSRYYKLPPGHLKKLYRSVPAPRYPPHGHGKKHKHK